MAESRSLLPWPVLRQLTSGDLLGRGKAVRSRRTDEVEPRTTTADRVARSVCPYCAVGCGQRVFVKDEQGRPDRGRPGQPGLARPAVPQGLGEQEPGHQPPARRPRSRTAGPTAPSGRSSTSTTAMDMIADRVLEARGATRGRTLDEQGRPLRRTHGHRQPGRRDAGQRGELPHQEAVHRDGRASRSRTRPVFDTPPPSPVWGPASAVAAPPASSRTWPTLTASSSRAPTWPRPTRWASSG